MRIRRSRVVGAVLAAGASAAAVVAAPGFASAGSDSRAIGLTDSGKALVKFDTDRPDPVSPVGTVAGLAGDAFLVGIDYRVQDGKLYGVGNAGGVYTLSDKNAAATKVTQLSIALNGNALGVDFNPAANALRIVSNTGQNLRQPFATAGAATVADGALNYLAVTATGVTGAAYTNNDLNVDTATTLFDLDTMMDQVAIQSPANSGSLSATGKLGVNADLDAGFDIFASLRRGKTVENTGYATIGVGGHYSLYSVNLLTGQVESEGKFRSPVTDIAVQLD